MQHNPDVERLRELSQAKLILLENILELTIKQSKDIAEEAVEQLESHTAEKQEVIDNIDRLNHEIDGILKDCKELQQTTEQITGLLKKISYLENKNNEKALILLNKFSENIKNVSRSREANSAYIQPQISEQSYFFDRKR